jgi:membrane fusion protein (multidrug efflux system)
MLRSSVLVLLLPLLLTHGCANEASANVEPAPAAIHVASAKVEVRAVPRTVRLPAVLEGAVEANLAAGASGRVLEMRVAVGERVKKGDVLAKLDTQAVGLAASEAAKQAELARSRRASAARECERASKLFEGGAIAKQEFDRLRDQCATSELDVQAAELRAGQAQKNVIDGVIRSPLDGVVNERFVEVGEFVRADSSVVRLVSNDRLRLAMEAPESIAPAARVGSEVVFTVTAYPGRSWRTKIDRGGVSVRKQSRDVVVEAPIDNADGALLPGMFGMVELSVGTEELPTVPATALLKHAGKTHVFVIERGHANERSVFVGPELAEGRVAIRKGLGLEDSVVIAPPEELQNGQAVE